MDRPLVGAAGTQAPSALCTAGISHSDVGRLRGQRGTAASFALRLSAETGEADEGHLIARDLSLAAMPKQPRNELLSILCRGQE